MRNAKDDMIPGLFGTSRKEVKVNPVVIKVSLYIEQIVGKMQVVHFGRYPGHELETGIFHRSIRDMTWAWQEGFVYTATSRRDQENRAGVLWIPPTRYNAMRPFYIRLVEEETSTPESRLRILMKIATVSYLPSYCDDFLEA
jgi:hypothetical protein